jgi:tRNA (guanine26-N2/guanine27-N2)-dimethyltransferase
MYCGPIHNPAFIERMLTLLPSLDSTVYNTLDRIEGMLETAHEEMQLFKQDDLFAKSALTTEKKKHSYAQLSEAALDRHPFYVVPSALARVVRCQAPSINQLRGALRHAGYQAVRSHAKPGSIKTDAPWSAIWHIMREWVRQKAPIREGALKKGMAGFRIMQGQEANPGASPTSTRDQPDSIQTNSEEIKTNGEVTGGEKGEGHAQSVQGTKPSIVFDERLGRDKENKRLVRYQTNPRANWGPMARAK